MTLIDTSAWIELLRRNGRPEIKRRVSELIEAGTAAYCGPVEFELLAGARPSELGDIRAALSFCTMMDFGRVCWQQAAEVEAMLRRTGVTVPRDDVFVAAAALHHRVAVYAVDPHFELMRTKGRLPLQLVA